MSENLIIAIASTLFVLLSIVWIHRYGLKRGLLAIFFRMTWVLPIIVSIYPEVKIEKMNKSLSLTPVHVLIDDSASMISNRTEEGERFLDIAKKTVEKMRRECLLLGCLLRETNLSSLDNRVKENFTPLSSSLVSWLEGIGQEPWMLISDGGDYLPNDQWDPNLKNRGIIGGVNQNGMVFGLKLKKIYNLWIESPEILQFSFEDKPTVMKVTLKREGHDLKEEAVQVHVSSGTRHLISVNPLFQQEESSLELSINLPPLTRGYHLLSIKALPTGRETSFWDNVTYKEVEILPNTVGILHLLGAPSWSGRFLRRYLKSEPKYDLISFFILRDPGDMQLVSERELSLIPFPVDRLFNEELPNFKAVILQNFSLFRFLEPEYQKNLIQFVKDGGGILFLGGDRALRKEDYRMPALQSILPFETHSGVGDSQNQLFRADFDQDRIDRSGPFYDPFRKFRIGSSHPTPEQRALADVFEDWEEISQELSQIEGLSGLHHMENVTFKEGKYTPLLQAISEDGSKTNLSVASYPGKGRALWIFSDALWKMALSSNLQISREIYHQFIGSAMTWLLRQELKKPLLVRNMKVHRYSDKRIRWHIDLMGPASMYFDRDNSWTLSICGQRVHKRSYHAERIASDRWSLSGFLSLKIMGNMECKAKIQGEHIAFGSVSAIGSTVISKIFSDSEIIGSTKKLEDLIKLTGAQSHIGSDLSSRMINNWLAQFVNSGLAAPSSLKSYREFYWILDRIWLLLLVVGILLEVMVRRWPQLMAQRK